MLCKSYLCFSIFDLTCHSYLYIDLLDLELLQIEKSLFDILHRCSLCLLFSEMLLLGVGQTGIEIFPPYACYIFCSLLQICIVLKDQNKQAVLKQQTFPFLPAVGQRTMLLLDLVGTLSKRFHFIKAEMFHKDISISTKFWEG